MWTTCLIRSNKYRVRTLPYMSHTAFTVTNVHNKWCCWSKHYFTLQEHQLILTNATISKDSDILTWRYYNGGLLDFFFIFQANLRNQEIAYQHNIAEKYYKIGRSKLCWDIWGLFKNGPNITHFFAINYIINHMTMHFFDIWKSANIKAILKCSLNANKW